MKKVDRILFFIVVLGLTLPQFLSAQINEYNRSINLSAEGFRDQDDMCVWEHPTDASLSTIISSDKSAGKLFIYDLDGGLIDTLPVRHPGNVDVRYDFPFGGELIDIVALNSRGEKAIQVFRVDPDTRSLSRIDDGSMTTGVNYGFSLYISPLTGKYFAFVSSYPHYDNTIWQFELKDNGHGKITGSLVRSFPIVDSATVEGIVTDDEAAFLYIGEEGIGIRKYSAEPDGGDEGELIRSIANDPLEADVEGLTISYLPDGEGFIIASSQRDGQAFMTHYDLFERTAPHEYVTSFKLCGVGETDGIDICTANLGSRFPHGIFVAHNASEHKQLVVTDWGVIAKGEKIKVDPTYWIRRKPAKK